MTETFIITGTVTYAMRAREILNRQGFKAEVATNSSLGSAYGCGYGVRLRGGDPGAAIGILKRNGVKVLGTGGGGR